MIKVQNTRDQTCCINDDAIAFQLIPVAYNCRVFVYKINVYTVNKWCFLTEHGDVVTGDRL